MWSYQQQVDTWINLGNKILADDWVRGSQIQRVYTEEGGASATVMLKDGTKVLSGYTTQQLMKVIADISRKPNAPV